MEALEPRLLLSGGNQDPEVIGPIWASPTDQSSAFTVDLLLGASDPDPGDTLSVLNLALDIGDPRGITQPSANSLRIDPTAYGELMDGESETIVYNYDIVDGNGGSVGQQITFNVSGTGHHPEVIGPIWVSPTEQNSAFTVDLLLGASDADPGDILSVSGLTLDSGDPRGMSQPGANSLRIDPSAYNYLDAGETETIVYTYDIVDDDFGSVGQMITFAVSGLAGPPELAIDDVTVDEAAGTATFTVSLDSLGDEDISIDYATSDGTAAAGSDYTATSGALTIPAGDMSATITVPISEDSIDEYAETFSVNLSNPVNAIIADGTGVGTILDNDDPPTVSISDAPTTEEGNDATFTVSLSEPSERTVTVNYWTNDGTALGGIDYASVSGTTLTFAPGETSKTVVVSTLEEIVHEPDENFTVRLGSPVNATITDAEGIGTILNDDPLPGFSISDDDEFEWIGSSNLIFNVTLPYPQEGVVAVNYATSDGTATAGVDYTATSGTVTFAPGEILKEIAVPILPDSVYEANETLTVTLSNPTGGMLLEDPIGVGTITNDDPMPLLTIDNAPAMSEQFGMGMFTLILSSPSEVATTVDYTTVDGTASAGADYTAKSGTVIFAPGETSKSISIAYLDDAIYEGDETYTVQLSNVSGAILADATGDGTIEDNELPPTISVSDVSLPEGDAGTTDFDFTVSLSHASSQSITKFYETVGDAAIVTSDLTFTNGTITFAPGETSKTVTVQVLGDTDIEPDEQFGLAVTDNPPSRDPGTGDLNGTLIVGLGTILDDDEPVISIIGDATVDEGNAASYRVSYVGNPVGDLTVDLTTGPGTTPMADATEGVDYVSADQTVTFLAGGANSIVIPVRTIVDDLGEGDEEFTVSLSNASQGTIAPGADAVDTVIANTDRYGTLATARDIGRLPVATFRGLKGSVDGTINRNDYVKFTVGRFTRLTATLTGMTRNVRFQLLNAAGQVIKGSNRPGRQDQQIIRCVRAGTYYLRAFRLTPGVSDYIMRVIGYPDRDRFSRPQAENLGPITAPRIIQGEVGQLPTTADRYDWYAFRVTGPRQIVATLSGLSLNANLRLLDATGRTLRVSRNVGTSDERIVFNALRAGRYFIQVCGCLPTPTPYTLTINAT